MAYLNGIDISSYQATLDPEKVPGDFIIVKATQGTGYINHAFEKHAEAVLRSGKALGFYHYANGSGVAGEVNFFLQTVGKYIGKAFLCLDWEYVPNAGENREFRNPAYAKAFMDEVRKRIGLTMFIYGSKDSCFNSMDWSAIMKDAYPLWGAQYGSNNIIYGYIQNPWQSARPWGAWGQNVTMHQYTSALRIPGYSGNLDGNICYLTFEALKGYAQAGSVGTVVTEPAKTEPLDKANLLELVALTMEDHFGRGDERKRGLGDRYEDVQEFINHIAGTPADELAAEVITGKYGNTPMRERVLGPWYDKVQAAVNRKVKGQKSITDIARDVLARKYGDEPIRTQKLRAAGYDSVLVQKEVNRLLGV